MLRNVNSRHWFTTSFLQQEDAGKRCSECEANAIIRAEPDACEANGVICAQLDGCEANAVTSAQLDGCEANAVDGCEANAVIRHNT